MNVAAVWYVSMVLCFGLLYIRCHRVDQAKISTGEYKPTVAVAALDSLLVEWQIFNLILAAQLSYCVISGVPALIGTFVALFATVHYVNWYTPKFLRK